MWRFDNMISGFGIFSLRMRRNDYLGASCQKSDPAIRSGDLDFLQDWYISTIRWRLRHIFDVMCTISYDLVTLSFDLWTLAGSDGLSHPTHIPIFAPHDYPFLSYVWLNLITVPSTGTVLRMRSITWPVHRGSPKTTRKTFLTPTYLFTIQLLWGFGDD